MNKTDNKRPLLFDPIKTAATLFCILAAAVATYVFFAHLLKLLLPFLLGATIAWIARAISFHISKHTRASSKIVSSTALIALIGSIGGILFFSIRRLTSELGRLAESLTSENNPLSDLSSRAIELIKQAGEKFARLFPESSASEISEKLNNFTEEIINDIVSRIASAVPEILTSILKALPDIFLGLIVTVICAFYLTLDYVSLKRRVGELLSLSARRAVSKIKNEAAVAALGYLRAYSLIVLITFAEIFFGLSVLGVDYSFLIAAISALVDVLPILGVGTVLIPWAIFCLVTQNIFRGIGLIILYVIIAIVRQFIEPKIVGESLGMHPLIALATFYLGYKLFGFVGIFLAPVALIMWRAFGARSSEGADVS